jgi:chemotaxis protein MotB
MSNFFQEINKKQKAKAHEPLWMLAYIDLLTNLMAVFVLLLSMSTIDKQKFDAVSKEVTNQKTDSLEELKKKIDDVIVQNSLQNVVKTDLGMFGLKVSFLNGVMFQSASAHLSGFAIKEASPILDILSKSDAKYFLSLEGHTDDLPIRKNGEFRDNWALSSARGVSLLNKMEELGVPSKRMSVAGFAEIQPAIEIMGKQGKDLEVARAYNRRVVVRVYQ